MHWYERVAEAIQSKHGKVRAEIGRELGITGQAVTLKLQGHRPVYVEELKVLARWAGMSVAEALGDDAVVIELRDEMDLIELYRLLNPEQRKMLLGLAQQLAAKQAEPTPSRTGAAAATLVEDFFGEPNVRNEDRGIQKQRNRSGA